MEKTEFEALFERVDRLERELQARTIVLEQLLASTALKQEEIKSPGTIAKTLEKVEMELSAPRENESDEQRTAFRDAYRRILMQVNAPPPWQTGGSLADVVSRSALYLWDKWKTPRDKPPAQ